MKSVPFNFVIACSDQTLSDYKSLDPEKDANVFTNGNFCWCLRSYLILSKRNKLNVQCSNHLINGAINLVHSDQLLQLKGNADQFIVCVRADYPKRRWAHYHIVQNKRQILSNTSFIPHWLQPGLIKRDLSRHDVLKVAYSGQLFNGNFAGSEEAWRKLFAPYGIEFVTLTAGAWHDLSNVDVLIALRSFDSKPHNTKPPSKLFSAWHSQIPLVAGYDSAFLQVVSPGKEYLLAKTPEEVVNCVLQLKNDPTLYKTIVENGLKKTLLYNETTIAETWENVLINPIMNRYQQWERKNFYERIRFKILLKAGILEHQSKQIIKRLLKIKS